MRMAVGNGKVLDEDAVLEMPETHESDTDPAQTPRRRGRRPKSIVDVPTEGPTKTLTRSRTAGSRVFADDKPIFTLSVAAEMLALHPRTLRIYEEEGLVIPFRTQTARRRYSQNDIRKFQFIQYLTRTKHVNLAGVRLILDLMDDLKEFGVDVTTTRFADYQNGD